ncbi:uncharacterized protein MONBRDRAFT_37501 [Monosiga brevicollis MX1]|uniref:Ribosomal RNA large subunit methyltransferase K/L-like methyltransferase domain-containing protein n=1 Tax=Monosiga brevicollis TaxID=81824 RepID=A9V244_MONBE|nr:uncharacterized protein MONBRDRAFT_37501 [Monosiga brevicollis MX1]EDQ88316.1 predicted protein [Monosiga brevicollis MX1]|eukprot:XP_001746909.1 hypothetical protein [Monosiga brevicollis MX1]
MAARVEWMGLIALLALLVLLGSECGVCATDDAVVAADDAGNVHISATAESRVYINGVDVLARLAVLEGVEQLLIDLHGGAAGGSVPLAYAVLGGLANGQTHFVMDFSNLSREWRSTVGPYRHNGSGRNFCNPLSPNAADTNTSVCYILSMPEAVEEGTAPLMVGNQVLKIVSNETLNEDTGQIQPGAYPGFLVVGMQPKLEGHAVVVRFTAKIPVGFAFVGATNPGYSVDNLLSAAGTGNAEHYAFRFTAHNNDVDAPAVHIWLSGPTGAAVTYYIYALEQAIVLEHPLAQQLCELARPWRLDPFADQTRDAEVFAACKQLTAHLTIQGLVLFITSTPVHTLRQLTTPRSLHACLAVASFPRSAFRRNFEGFPRLVSDGLLAGLGGHALDAVEAWISSGHGRWALSAAQAEAYARRRHKDDAEATAVFGITVRSGEEIVDRHRTEQGYSSLQTSVAAGLGRIARPWPNEVCLDPMCGAMTIAVETVTEFPDVTFLNSDIDRESLATGKANVNACLPPSAQARILSFYASARHLPLGVGAVDRVVCDMPWGKRCSKPRLMRKLYPLLLVEWARVVRPGGRAYLLTMMRKCMEMHLTTSTNWQQLDRRQCNVGGIKAYLYTLERTDAVVDQN